MSTAYEEYMEINSKLPGVAQEGGGLVAQIKAIAAFNAKKSPAAAAYFAQLVIAEQQLAIAYSAGATGLAALELAQVLQYGRGTAGLIQVYQAGAGSTNAYGHLVQPAGLLNEATHKLQDVALAFAKLNQLG